jgi:hypothetical protein
MPPVEADQVTLTVSLERAVAVTWAGAEGGASVVADTVVDIGETFPPVAVS